MIPKYLLGGNIFAYSTSENETNEMLTLAHNRGIRAIDTSSSYSGGESELLIGNWFKNHPATRDSWFISTKVGRRSDESADGIGSPERITSSLRSSMQRLAVDYIDVIFIHAPDPITPVEITVETLCSFYNKGLLKGVGISNATTVDIRSYLNCLIDAGFDTNNFFVQNYFNWAKRPQNYWIDLKRNLGGDWKAMSYGVLARGLFAKSASKWADDLSSRKSKSQSVANDFFQVQNQNNLSKVKMVLDQYGMSLFDYSLTASFYASDSQIVAVRTPAQLQALANTVDTLVSEQKFEEVRNSIQKLDLVWASSLGDPTNSD